MFNQKVNVIDTEKLCAKVTEMFGKANLEEGESYTLFDRLCVITNPKGGMALLNRDAVGNIILTNNQKLLDTTELKVKFFTDSEKGTSIMPTLEISLPITQFIKEYTKEEVTFKEFQGNRHNYNPRIESNQWEIKRWFGK